MTKLLKITAKVSASTLIFGAAGIVVLNALFVQDFASIANAAAMLFAGGFVHEMIWG